MYLIFEAIDLPFPFVYNLIYISSVTFVYQKTFDKTHPIQKVNLIPHISLFADLLENSLIILLLVFYPTKIMIIANILPVITLIKYTAQYVTYAFFIFGVIVLIIKKIKERKASTQNS